MQRHKFKHLKGQDRIALRSLLAQQYATGSSIRALAAIHQISIGLCRNLLVESDTPLRPKSGDMHRMTGARAALEHAALERSA